MESTAGIEEKEKAQNEYCREHSLPRFVPLGGDCFWCGKNVYRYYSLEYCANNQIVGCPYCNTTFCG